MGHFDIVTNTIENAGWYPFLSNLEDGFIIYHFDAVAEEIVYGNWDVIDGEEIVRFVDPRKPYGEDEIAACEIYGSEEEIQSTMEEFFYIVDNYLAN